MSSFIPQPSTTLLLKSCQVTDSPEMGSLIDPMAKNALTAKDLFG